MAAVVRLQPCLLRMAAVCVLQPSGWRLWLHCSLAQPSLGKMAVKEPAQPFWCHTPRLAQTVLCLPVTSGSKTDRLGTPPSMDEDMAKEFKQQKSLSQHTGSTQVRTGAC